MNDLDPICEDVLQRAANMVPNNLRRVFYSGVARRLKPLKSVTVTDIRYATSAVLGELRQQQQKRRIA